MYTTIISPAHIENQSIEILSMIKRKLQSTQGITS